MKTSTLAIMAVSSLCWFSGCAKKSTPPIEDLTTGVDFQLLGYHQYYAKDSTGVFQITSTGSTVAFGLTGNFLEEQIVTSQDSVLPDVSKGFYNRFTFVAPDTLKHQYRSTVAGQPMESHLSCPVSFTAGSSQDLQSGKEVTLTHTPVGLSELKTMYVMQLEREYTPMVTDMMWKEIIRKSKDLFDSSEVRQRYRLTVSNRIDTVELDNSSIRIKGDSAVVWFPNRLYFSLKFTGRVDILK